MEFSMKNKITLTLILLISLSLSSLLKANDNLSIGVELGYGFLDVGAADTATTITNTAGTTVSHDADEEAWVGRLFGDFKIIDSLYIDAGYFVSGSVDAKFTKSGVSTTEAYTAKGFDFSLVFKADESAGFFLKGGAHASEVDGEANIVINGTIYQIQTLLTQEQVIYLGPGMILQIMPELDIHIIRILVAYQKLI